jgi:hypothetical protein
MIWHTLPGLDSNKQVYCLLVLTCHDILEALHPNDLLEAPHHNNPQPHPQPHHNDLPGHMHRSHHNDPLDMEHPGLLYPLLYCPQPRLLKNPNSPNSGWCCLVMNPVFTRHCKSNLSDYSITLTIPSTSARHAIGAQNSQPPLPANSRQSANQIFVDGYMARRVNRVN